MQVMSTKANQLFRYTENVQVQQRILFTFLAENPWKRVVAWQDNEKQPISTAKNI
jgi:hypothetical protein